MSEIVSLSYQEPPTDVEPAITTFIIASIGRPTINESLTSLQQQTNPNWKAIIVYDNKPIAPIAEEFTKDKRIVQVRYNGRTGPGWTRNHGIQMTTTKWVSFLDDDDSVYEKYVEFLQDHDETYENLDAVIFRMRHFKPHLDPLPGPDCKSVIKFQLGISFSLNVQMLRDCKLQFPMTFPCEDFILMNKVFESKRKILISGHVTYFVRHAKKKYDKYDDVIVCKTY